jgi:beta-glucosidase
MPWEPRVPAILQAWYPGQEGGRALARILFGDTNPSGCLPDTVPHRLEDLAAMKNYPGDGTTVKYEEGLFIGYRHFDHANIKPHYPFGFGLSYTEFEFSQPRLSSARLTADETIHLELEIKNIGLRSGQVVVQLYVRPISLPVERPVKELRAFHKVDLAPREQSTISFMIGRRELEYYDTATSSWRVSPGRYELIIARHSRSLGSVCAEVEIID